MVSNYTAQNLYFGYKCGKNSYEIYEAQAAAIKWIFHLYLNNNSLSDISESLQELKICSPRNKLVWGKQIISNILSNPVYVGTDDYPQIITKEDFDAAQVIKAKNTKCRKK